MYEIAMYRKTIPQDLPTHWSIYRDDKGDPDITVWTSYDDAKKICDFLNGITK